MDKIYVLQIIGIVFIIIGFRYIIIPHFKHITDDPNRCDCKLQCGYCKEMEASKKNQSITENCKHPNIITEVLQTVVNCETTIDVCADCDKRLSEPKTECR